MSPVDQRFERTAVAISPSAWRFLTPACGDAEAGSNLSPRFLAVMTVAGALLVPSRMLLSRGQSDDSAVFAYVGWAMKHGLMPYRDIWDHKGPLLYYLQYAGFSLTPNSTLGIGLIEVVALCVAFLLTYRIVASFASKPVSIAIAIFSVAFVT